MPTPLPTISLASANVGSTGTINLSQCAPTSNPAFTNKNATLLIYNESGVGLRLTGQVTGVAFDLPAGGWTPQPIPPGETTINYTVLYVLQNQPVSQLIATYYQPNEPVSLATLGNSPIGLSTNVPLNATATAVANDGNPAGTIFVESSVSSVVHCQIFNDGFLLLQKDATSTDQNLQAWIDLAVGGHNWETYLKTGATHALYFKDLTSTNIPLLLLASGGIQTDNGAIVTDGSGNITTVGAITASGIEKITKTISASNQYFLQMLPSDQATFQWGWGVSSTGNALVSDLNTGTIALTIASGAAGGLKLTSKGNFVQAWSFFSGTGTGTFNHGLGTTPNVVLAMQSSVGSQTMGWDTANATSVHITAGNGAAWSAMALLMA